MDIDFETNCRQLIQAKRKIFPLKFQKKSPLKKGRSKCITQTDDEMLAEMLNAEEKTGTTNIGMITGADSGVLTIDCDFKHPEAEEFWEQWKDELKQGVEVRTSGGYHYHFKHPGRVVNTEISQIRKGVDLLCDKENKTEPPYVVVPFSIHPDGPVYQYGDDDPMALKLWDDLPDLPPSLDELVSNDATWERPPKPQAPTNVKKEEWAEWYAENPGVLFSVDPYDDEPIEEGRRNNDMSSIAGKLLAMHRDDNLWTADDLFEEMVQINNIRCSPPLDEAEVNAICESISKCKTRREQATAPKQDQENYKFQLSDEEKQGGQAAGTAFVAPEALAIAPSEKPQITTRTVNRCAIWILHNSLFKPTIQGGDFSLVYIGGEFYLYNDNVWRRVEEQFIQSVIQSIYMDATRGNVTGVLEFFKNVLYYPVRNFPFWKGANPPGYPKDCRKLIPFKNGLFDVEYFVNTGDLASSLKPHHYGLFNTVRLNYDFDPTAQCVKWKAFLASLWGSDTSDRAEALREWAGHTMIPDITQHKICLMHGVPRSGKSTIGRLLFEIIGKENAASTDLHSLATDHGPSSLLGKNLAVLFDAHLPKSSHGDRALEKLKGISGGDPQLINPKFLSAYTVVLSARLMIICNEMPRLKDSGSALLARMIPFRCDKSFVGQENIHLQAELSEELPGIAVWAIEGLRRYISNGYLMRPREAIEDLQNIKRVLNPAAAFMDDCLDHTCDSNDMVSMDDLYKAWATWCEINHIYATGTKDRFFSQLRATCPPISQPRIAGVMHWSGLKLKQTAESLAAADMF